MLRQLGRLAEAEQCARTAVEVMVSVAGHRAVLAARLHVMGPEHPNALSSHADLALVLREMGRLQEAEAQHRIALDTRIRLLGPEHPDTLSSRSSFAGLLRRLGRLEEAEQEHAAVLEARRRTLGDEHRWSKWSRSTASSCGHVYVRSGLITPRRGSAGCTWPVSCETWSVRMTSTPYETPRFGAAGTPELWPSRNCGQSRFRGSPSAAG